MVMPSKTGETIVVQINRKLLVWTDGQLTGDKELVQQARLLSRLRVLMHFPFTEVRCNLDDPNNPAGAIAAMWGVMPGRAHIMEGYPDIVQELFGGIEEDPSIGNE